MSIEVTDSAFENAQRYRNKEGAPADAFLRPFLKRERETLQVRYRIARRYWLKGETSDAVKSTIQRMARHPLYPRLAAEARDLLAPPN